MHSYSATFRMGDTLGRGRGRLSTTCHIGTAPSTSASCRINLSMREISLLPNTIATQKTTGSIYLDESLLANCTSRCATCGHIGRSLDDGLTLRRGPSGPRSIHGRDYLPSLSISTVERTPSRSNHLFWALKVYETKPARPKISHIHLFYYHQHSFLP